MRLPAKSTQVNPLDDPEFLREFAKEQGIEIPEKKTGGIFGTLERAIDIFNAPLQSVGGLLSGTTMAEGREKNITPGQAIFGKPDESKPRFGAERVTGAVARAITDFVFDPVTYATLGTGTLFKPAVKVGIRGFEKVAINKKAKELTTELATELAGGKQVTAAIEKKAKETVFRLVGDTGAKTAQGRGGIAMIKRAFEKTGKPFTEENLKEAIEKGVTGLIDPGGLKYMGKVLIPGNALKYPFKKAFSSISQVLRQTENGKLFAEGLDKIGAGVGGIFKRDISGLPGRFVVLKQALSDDLVRAGDDLKKETETIFGLLSPERRKKIGRASWDASTGKVDIKKATEGLDAEELNLFNRIQQIFDKEAEENSERGMLKRARETYIQHIYKNADKAKLMFGKKGSPAFSRERMMNFTFDEAVAEGLEPVEDIGELFYTRRMSGIEANKFQDYFWGTTSIIKRLKSGTPARDQAGKQALGDDLKKEIIKIQGKPSRLAKELGIAGKVQKTEHVPFETWRNEGRIINAVDEAIKAHRAIPLEPFVDVHGRLPKNMNVGPYKFNSIDEAQAALKEFNDLKLLREGIRTHLETSPERLDLLGQALKILGKGDIYDQGTLGLAPKITGGVFNGENFNDVQKIATDMQSWVIDQLKMADAGRRIQDPITLEWSGMKSTFPDWVPKDLRRRDLFDSVIKHLQNGTVPRETKRLPKDMVFTKDTPLPDVADAKKLYDLAKKEMAQLTGLSVDEFDEVLTTPSLFPERGGLAIRDMEYVKQLVKENPELKTRVLEAGERLVRLGDISTQVPKEYRDFNIPENIAKDILQMDKQLLQSDDINYLLKQYIKWMNFWKGSVTVLFPSFHGRNAVSNIGNFALDAGLEAINPMAHAKAVKILSGADGEIVNEFGTKYTFAEIRKLMAKHQIVQSQYSRAEITKFLGREGLEKQAGKLNVSAYGRTVGRSIENEARALSFIKQLKRGFDPEDAAARVKEFLFDYDNLSKFEKLFLRNAIPFYTFTRKNVALQLKTLVTKPGATGAQFKAYKAMEELFAHPKTEDEEKYAPEYVKEGLNWMIGHKGDDRTFLVGFDLPIESAFKNLNHPLKQALSMITPPLKIMGEMATGVNFFKQQKISEDDSGNFAKDYPDAFKRLLDYTEIEKTTKDGKPYTIRTVDPESKWIFQQISSLGFTSRFLSGRNLEQLNSFVSSFKSALQGKEVSWEDKINILGFFTGLRTAERSIEAEKFVQQKAEARSIQDVLERKGEGAFFEKFYIPKEKEFNKGFGSFFSRFKRKK